MPGGDAVALDCGGADHEPIEALAVARVEVDGVLGFDVGDRDRCREPRLGAEV